MLHCERAQNFVSLNIEHGFFTREGGVSSHPFASLNCSYLVGDEPKNVEINRQKILNFLKLSSKQLMVPKIVHGNNVLMLNENDSAETVAQTEADALISCSTSHVLGMTYADCLAIMVAAEDASVVAIIHAGWRGLLNGVVDDTLRKIYENYSRITLRAAIGPALSKSAFHFSGDGFLQFEKRWPQCTAIENGKTFVDLVEVAKAQLSAYSIDVEKVGGWTEQDPVRYFSYRRDQKESGRHLAVICKK
ncbi:MAG: laccase domain-containing protein [Myxococcales bacterium]|nr:laccase domain-containing protein [Myxococcales bacterium]USN50991.1 MAG: laccase domain-containing protein [Myxococcales bacterium]